MQRFMWECHDELGKLHELDRKKVTGWLWSCLCGVSLSIYVQPKITPDTSVLHISVNVFASGCVSGMSHSSDKPKPCVFSRQMPKHMQQFSTEQIVRDGTSDTETNKGTICLHGLLRSLAFGFSFSGVVLSCRLC